MGDIFHLVVVMIIFFIILYFAYRASKLVGGSRFGGKKGKNIDLIESRATGMNSGVQLIRVGASYFLIGVTRDRITFLSEIDREKLDISVEEQTNGEKMPFSTAFEKIFADKMKSFRKK